MQAGRDDSNDAANLSEILPKAKRRKGHDSSRPTTRFELRVSQWALEGASEMKTDANLVSTLCTSLGLWRRSLKRVHKCDVIDC